jgi:hypothetical protein
MLLLASALPVTQVNLPTVLPSSVKTAQLPASPALCQVLIVLLVTPALVYLTTLAHNVPTTLSLTVLLLAQPAAQTV